MSKALPAQWAEFADSTGFLSKIPNHTGVVIVTRKAIHLFTWENQQRFYKNVKLPQALRKLNITFATCLLAPELTVILATINSIAIVEIINNKISSHRTISRTKKTITVLARVPSYPDMFVVGTANGVIETWTTTSQTPKTTVLTGNNCTAVDVSDNGAYIVMGSSSGHVTVIGLLSSRHITEHHVVHLKPVNSVAWSPSAAHVASCSDDDTIFIWRYDFDSNQLSKAFHISEPASVLSVAWLSTTVFISLTACTTNRVVVWSTERPKVPLYSCGGEHLYTNMTLLNKYMRNIFLILPYDSSDPSRRGPSKPLKSRLYIQKLPEKWIQLEFLEATSCGVVQSPFATFHYLNPPSNWSGLPRARTSQTYMSRVDVMPDNTSVIQYLLEHYDIAGHNNVQVCLYNSLVARRAGIYDEAQLHDMLAAAMAKSNQKGFNTIVLQTWLMCAQLLKQDKEVVVTSELSYDDENSDDDGPYEVGFDRATCLPPPPSHDRKNTNPKPIVTLQQEIIDDRGTHSIGTTVSESDLDTFLDDNEKRRGVIFPHDTLLESPDLVELMREAMEYYVEHGNVVMACSMLLAIGQIASELIAQPILEEWFRAYIDILERFQMWMKRAYVLNACGIPRITDDGHQGILYQSVCSKCERPFAEGGACQHCKLPYMCVICRQPVRSAILWCWCGHGGHIDHMLEWFSKHAHCPGGCGHQCELMRNKRSHCHEMRVSLPIQNMAMHFQDYHVEEWVVDEVSTNEQQRTTLELLNALSATENEDTLGESNSSIQQPLLAGYNPKNAELIHGYISNWDAANKDQATYQNPKCDVHDRDGGKKNSSSLWRPKLEFHTHKSSHSSHLHNMINESFSNSTEPTLKYLVFSLFPDLCHDSLPNMKSVQSQSHPQQQAQYRGIYDSHHLLHNREEEDDEEIKNMSLYPRTTQESDQANSQTHSMTTITRRLGHPRFQ